VAASSFLTVPCGGAGKAAQWLSADVAFDGFSGHGHCVPGTYGVAPWALQPFGHTPTQTKTSKFSGLHVHSGMLGCFCTLFLSQQTFESGSTPSAIMFGTGLTEALCFTTALSIDARALTYSALPKTGLLFEFSLWCPEPVLVLHVKSRAKNRWLCFHNFLACQ
jgi:hypothetical protein